MWELTGFSFIFDWFANFGSTLGSWTPNLGIKGLASWTTVEYTCVQKNNLATIANGPVFDGCNYANLLSHSGFKSQEIDVTTRTAKPDRPIVPQLKVKLDGFKLADLLIILRRIL
jgi:hypothetical protein